MNLSTIHTNTHNENQMTEVLVKARNLPKMDTFFEGGSCDPFFNFYLDFGRGGFIKAIGGQHNRIENQLQGSWGFNIPTMMLKSAERYKIEFFDHDLIGSNDFIGQFQGKIGELFENGEKIGNRLVGTKEAKKAGSLVDVLLDKHNSTEELSNEEQIRRKMNRLRLKAREADGDAKKFVVFHYLTLIPLVFLNIALTIGPSFIPEEKVSFLQGFTVVIGALNTAIVTFTTQFQFKTKEEVSSEKATMYASLATELENIFLFPGFQNIYTDDDWLREIQKMASVVTDVEKKIGGKTPDLLKYDKAQLKMVHQVIYDEVDPDLGASLGLRSVAVNKSLV